MSKELMIGSILQVTVDIRRNGGQSIAAGSVTRIGRNSEGTMLNVRVFLDTGEHMMYYDVPLVEGPPEEIAEHRPERVAFWPVAS